MFEMPLTLGIMCACILQSKVKSGDSCEVHEQEDRDHSESSVSSKGRNSHSYNSPSFSDDEMTGRLSPFHLDR